MRAMLFRSTMVIIAKGNEFKTLHQHLISRPNNPLKKKQSMIALSVKLIKVMFTIWNNQTDYDGTKLLTSLDKRQLKQSA